VLCDPNEGITANNVPAIGGPLGLTDSTEVFAFVSVTAAYNQLSVDTGVIWWIDASATSTSLITPPPPRAHFDYLELSQLRAMTATGTLIGYGNIVYAVSNLTVVPGVAQQQTRPRHPTGPARLRRPRGYRTYTLPQAAAVARDLYLGSLVTQFPMASITRLLLNGVDITDAVYSGLSGYDFEQCYWFFPGSISSTRRTSPTTRRVPPTPNTAPYPNPGDVLEISYIRSRKRRRS